MRQSLKRLGGKCTIKLMIGPELQVSSIGRWVRVASLVLIFSLLLVGIIAVLFYLFAPVPLDLEVTNVSDQSAVVSWITKNSVERQIVVSDNSYAVVSPVLSSFWAKRYRDANPTKLHYITLTGLTPGKTYHLRVTGQSHLFYFQTKVASANATVPFPAYGTILQRDGKTPAAGVLVLFGVFSAQTNNNGNWTFNLPTTFQKSKFGVSVIGGDLGSATFALDPLRAQPTTNVILK